MYLHLTAFDQQSNIHEFSCDIEQLEMGFDVLNLIVAKGDKLISVRLTDEHGTIDLPIEAFDGISGMELIHQLESEWKSILEKPSHTEKAFHATLLNLTNRRLTACEDQINRIEPLIIRVESLLVCSQKMNISLDAKQMLESSYQHTLRLYHRQLDRAFLTHEHLLHTIRGLG